MKSLLAFILLAVAFIWGGCASTKDFVIPNMSATSVDITERDPAGGTTIHLDGVKTLPDGTVTADNATWSTVYPTFSATLAVKGLAQTPQQAASPGAVVSIKKP